MTDLSRRSMLTRVGIGAAAAAAAVVPLATESLLDDSGAATGTETEEQEVGPFYVQDGLVRSDITAGEDGVPLELTMTVIDAESAEPLVGAFVDVWHANALGVYSDEASESTLGETYLRGIQKTDSAGRVVFSTIVPGWYSGRTDHIHMRVYTGGSVTGTNYDYTGSTLIYTGQMFFAADVDAAVAQVAPYKSSSTARTLNSTDRVYTQQGGAESVIATTGSASAGFAGTFTLTVDGGGSAVTSGADATRLTLAASPSVLVAGAALSLSGVLTDTATSAGLVNQTITIVRKLASGATRRPP
jgi:protocatechuate 3,4-dioxygenase beta subunit